MFRVCHTNASSGSTHVYGARLSSVDVLVEKVVEVFAFALYTTYPMKYILE